MVSRLPSHSVSTSVKKERRRRMMMIRLSFSFFLCSANRNGPKGKRNSKTNLILPTSNDCMKTYLDRDHTWSMVCNRACQHTHRNRFLVDICGKRYCATTYMFATHLKNGKESMRKKVRNKSIIEIE